LAHDFRQSKIENQKSKIVKSGEYKFFLQQNLIMALISIILELIEIGEMHSGVLLNLQKYQAL